VGGVRWTVVDDPVSKAPDRIAGMFDAIALRYDLLNHLLSAGIDRRWRSRAVRALALKGGEQVLDLCTGTGDLAIAAATAAPGAARVVGIDFAGAMLGVGGGKLRSAGLERRVTLVRADATQIPIGNATMDAVTIGFGMLGIGLRSKTGFPVLFGSLFGGMPLLMSLAFWAYAFAVVFTRARAIVLERDRHAGWTREAAHLATPRSGSPGMQT